MREAIVALLNSSAGQQSSLLRLLITGPLLLAAWPAVGNAFLEPFSVILIGCLLGLSWGIILTLKTGTIYLRGARPEIEETRTAMSRHDDLPGTGRMMAARVPRTLHSFAVPAEESEPSGSAGEKINLPLRG
jgi:hypothetical protein